MGQGLIYKIEIEESSNHFSEGQKSGKFKSEEAETDCHKSTVNYSSSLKDGYQNNLIEFNSIFKNSLNDQQKSNYEEEKSLTFLSIHKSLKVENSVIGTFIRNL